MHLIQQFTLEPRTSSRALGEKLSRQLPDLISDSVLPKIETCFDEIAPDQDIRIEKLVCDLGTISYRNLRTELPKLLVEALSKHFKNPPHLEHREIHPTEFSPRFSDISHSNLQVIEQNRLTQNSPSSQLEILLYVLAHGHFPWWFAEQEWTEVIQLQHWPIPVLKELRTELLRSVQAGKTTLLHRLIRHISADTLEAIQAIKVKPSLLASLKHMSEQDKRTILTIIWLATKPSPTSETPFIEWNLLKQLQQNQILSPETNALVEKLISHAPPVQDSPEAPATMTPGTDSPSSEHEPAILTDSTDPGKEEHPLSISNAGLILLHPFLPSLLREFKWLDDYNQILPEHRWTTIQALQYLCRGDIGFAEPTLVLEKILCGIPLAALAEFPELSEKIRHECDDLLKAAIQHWTILKSTSPDGLRDGFLQRPGLLSQVENQWHLQVEKKAIDVLLNHLPWPINLIKLPWLESPIHVQWQP